MKNYLLISIIAFLSILTQIQAATPVVEFGEVTTAQDWTTVNFSKTFTSPIVVVGPPSYYGAHQSIVRVKDVTATGFKVRVQEWDFLDGYHANEILHYMVVEQGSYTLSSGVKIEAGSLSLTDMHLKTQNFASSFSQTPVVMSSIVTEAEVDAVTTRVRNVNTSSFQIRLQEQEANAWSHANETVAYIAIDQGEIALGANSLKVGTQASVNEVWQTVDSAGYTEFVGGFQTEYGADAGALRRKGSVGTNLEVFFEEETSYDDEVAHVGETLGYILRKESSEPTIEFGLVTANHDWQTVNFAKTFNDPILVVGPPTYFGADESIVRVQNVNSTSFQIRVQEWDFHDGTHAFENINYMVMERGSHSLSDGRVIEAGTKLLNDLGNYTVNFETTQPSTPVVISSIVTGTGGSAITRRIKNIDQDSFDVRQQEEEATDNYHTPETISYIILPKGSYEADGELFLVDTKANVSGQWTPIDSTGYNKFISTFQTEYGGDAGSMRMSGTIGNNLQIVFDEDRSVDAEKDHAGETAGYVLVGDASNPPVITHQVTFTAGANGYISGQAIQTVNHNGSTIQVTAVPNSGYQFDKWSDNLTSATRTVTGVQADITLTAYFIVSGSVSGTLLSQSFELSDLNRRDSVTYGDGTTWSYTYDTLGNLDSATKDHGTDPSGDLNFNYSFDTIGNRLTASEAGVSKTYSSNKLNQYDEIDVDGTIITVLYDEHGNPTTNGDWDLIWDLEDRLTTMAHQTEDIIIEFKYDYRGFRGEKKVTMNGIVTKHIAYIYDGNLVSAEVDVRNGQQKLIRKYTWGLDPAGTKQDVGGIGALVGMESFNTDGSSQKHHVVSDAGGNVTSVLTSNSDTSLIVANTYEYGPFGQVIAKSEAVESPMQWQSKRVDSETGLIDYGRRLFDAINGRFLNQDPLGVDGGINLYNAVSNNIVNAYVGGQSYTDGMEIEVGDRIFTPWVDAFGFKGKGHHIVPWSLFNKKVSQAVQEYFDSQASRIWNEYYKSHNGKKMKGIPHHEYTKLVKEKLEKYLGSTALKDMTLKQAREFVSQIKNAPNSSAIRIFNKAIAEEARRDMKIALKAATEKAAKEAIEEATTKGAKKAGKGAKICKAIPLIGTVVTIGFWVYDVDNKGFAGGTANSLLDAIPFFGTGKIVAEMITGVDIVEDKQ